MNLRKKSTKSERNTSLKEVLDSRFMIEHYYSTNEETKQKTRRKIRDLTQRNEGFIPTIVISETIQAVCAKIGKQEAEICYLSIIASGLKILSLNPSMAKEAGLLKCRYPNIPMGDCIIAAAAIANQARVISDDPHFDVIKETKRDWI
jgi:predicted nucleic acid-binding protein